MTCCAWPVLGMPAWRYYGHSSAIATGINECAAWRLARAIGPPWDTLVPTGVMRWLPSAPALVGGWGPLVRKGNGPSGELTPLLVDSLCLPAAFFDALIGQQDRHLGNQRYEAATGRLTLIDHGFSFPGGHWHFNASVFVQQRHADGQQALAADEIAVLDALPGRAVWQELELVLGADQMVALEWRRATMRETGEIMALGREGFAS
jgi:hypothetical protein